MSAFLSILRETWLRYWKERCWRLAAAVAFYTLFAIVPLLLFLIAAGGALFVDDKVQRAFLENLKTFAGDQGTRAIREILDHFQRPESGWSAFVVGAITLLFGAVNALSQLRESFNTIWKLEPPAPSAAKLTTTYLLYLVVVAVIGALLLGSILLSWLLLSAQGMVEGGFPLSFILYRLGDFLVTVFIITLLVATLFKLLPAADLHWRDLWLGAGLTSVLFSAGKYLFAWYLSTFQVASAYGALSSIITFLLWVYFSTQMILFGAAFTCAFAEKQGRGPSLE